MSVAVIRHNLDQLNQTLVRYQRENGKSWPEVMAKKGGDLGFALRRQLLKIAPQKSVIREERLAALRAGEGIQVRESIRQRIAEKHKARTRLSDRRVVFGRGSGVSAVSRKGKRMNLQALAVQAEIHAREKARGFLGVSSRYPKTLKQRERVFSMFRRLLSTASITIRQDVKSARFEWPGDNPQSAGAVEGLEKGKGQAAIAAAIAEVDEDTRKFIEDRQRRALEQSFSLLERAILKRAI